jgi:ectoine hydroxylase
MDEESAMAWTESEMRQYQQDGYRLVRGLLDAEEMARLRSVVPTLLGGNDERDGMHREREKGSAAVRQVYAAHRSDPTYRALSRNPKLVDPVRQVLGGDAYIWHSKLNVKESFEGAVWLWHQDYGYWSHDGVEPQLVSAMVLLDRATVNNGCLMVVAGSHRWGLVEHELDTVTTSYKQWCIPPRRLRELLREEDIRHVTGEPGDVLFFDSRLVHGSGHNMSPLPRNTFIIAYNAVANTPRAVENPRPDWVVAREFETVT